MTEFSGVAAQMREGAVGVMPAKNGYMLVGSGAQNRYQETSRRIRLLKGKRAAAPLARVALPDEVIAAARRAVPQRAALVEMYALQPIIWAIPSEEFPEEAHNQPEFGITAARATWERGIVTALGGMLIASSANHTGHPTPRRIEDVDPCICAKADFVVDKGTQPPESDYGVVRLADLTIIRNSIILTEILQK